MTQKKQPTTLNNRHSMKIKKHLTVFRGDDVKLYKDIVSHVQREKNKGKSSSVTQVIINSVRNQLNNK